jgi:hypothetical protein
MTLPQTPISAEAENNVFNMIIDKGICLKNNSFIAVVTSIIFVLLFSCTVNGIRINITLP